MIATGRAAAYADVLAALRELDITERLNNLNLEIARIVDVRVKEGNAAPQELNLLQVEVERLRSRRICEKQKRMLMDRRGC